MPRSVSAAAALAMLLVLTIPAALLAAEPGPEPFVAALEDAGLVCTESPSTTGDGTEWQCSLEQANAALFSNILQGPGYLSVGSDYSSFEAGSTIPYPDAVVDIWHALVEAAVGDDPAAHAWLDGAMSGLTTSADSQSDELSVGEWALSWQTYCDAAECYRFAALTIQHSGPTAPEPTPPAPGSAPVACLEPDVIDAIEGLGSGTLPANAEAIAEALDAVPLEGTADEARDRLVGVLREPTDDEFALVLSSQIFRSEVVMDECGPESAPPSSDLAAYLESYGLSCSNTPDGTECTLALEDEAGPDATYTVVTRRDAAGDVSAIEVTLTSSMQGWMPSDAVAFARGIAERAPVPDPAGLAAWFDSAVSDPSTPPYESDEWSATWTESDPDTGSVWSLAIAREDDAGEGPAAPGPSAPPAGAPPSGARQPFAESVPTTSEISTDPIVVLQSLGLAALLVFLMPFPSQLFNSTLEEHEDEVRRWLRLDRIGSAVGRIGAFWASWPGVALFTVLAALLYGFLDPDFGLDAGSLATFVGMLLGILLVTVAFAIPAVMAHRRLGDRPSVKVVPVSLLIGVICVLLSRLTSFQPGYLYGLLIGLVFARELSEADEGRATAVGAVLMLAVALLAWIGLGALPDGDGFGLVVGRTALAALMVAGLEGVVFGLLPMRFLPGEPLYAWNRVLWGALLGIGAFAFFHILINPASGYLSDTSRTPLLTVVGLLIGFSLVSVAFWAWFRFRTEPAKAGV